MEKIKMLGKNMQKFIERGIGILLREVTTAVLRRRVECKCITRVSEGESSLIVRTWTFWDQKVWQQW